MDLQFVVRIANRKLADNADVPDALAFKGRGNASDLFFMDLFPGREPVACIELHRPPARPIATLDAVVSGIGPGRSDLGLCRSDVSGRMAGARA